MCITIISIQLPFCLAMDEPSSSSSIFLSRSPAIDRHNPIIRDCRRSSSIPLPSTHSPLPRVAAATKPPHHNKKKPKKKSSSNSNIIPPEENSNQAKKQPDETDVKISKNRWSRTKPAAGEFISPPGSTRYLLSEQVFFKDVSGLVPTRNTFPPEVVVKTNGSEESPSSSSDVSPDQVVVLRVSLHCRGCERKMRKHISRMKGVTSFDVDFVAKKVTVTGKITPLEVLSSISKVKNAQLWPPTLSSVSNPNQDIKGAAGAEVKTHIYK